MSQLVPIGQMGAAGRQIVETTPNVLATYRDAQVKEQQTRQNLALGEMRLQDARNSLAEYQYKQRGQNLRTRAWSGDAQARQEYARDYPDMLSADQKQVQEALARSAPALGPAVDQAMSMYEQGAQPEQVFQFLQQNANRTGELDSIYAPAGGFGPDDVAPDQLAQFRQQLAAVMPKPDAASDVGKLLADASRLEAQGDTEGAQVLRDAARNKGRGQRRLIRSVEGGRVVFRDGSTGDVVRQGGAAPQGSAPSQRRLTINKDGSVTMEEGPGLSTTRSMQLDAEVQDLDMAVKEVDRFLANIENAPAASAGLPGIVVSNAATLAESLGIDPGEIIHRGANALGSQTLEQAASTFDQIRSIRSQAEALLPFFLRYRSPDGRYSNADAQAAARHIDDFTSGKIGSVQNAKIKLKSIRDIMARLRDARATHLRQGRAGLPGDVPIGSGNAGVVDDSDPGTPDDIDRYLDQLEAQ